MNITTLNLLVCFMMVAVTGGHVLAWKKFKLNLIMAMVVGASALYGAIAVWADGGNTLAYTAFLVVYLICTQVNIATIAKGSARAVTLVTRVTDGLCVIAVGVVAYLTWADGGNPTALNAIIAMAVLGNILTRKTNQGEQAKALYLKH